MVTDGFDYSASIYLESIRIAPHLQADSQVGSGYLKEPSGHRALLFRSNQELFAATIGQGRVDRRISQ